MDALKKKFRQGSHAEAIAECEALCQADPGNFEATKLCATMLALVHEHARALEMLYRAHEIRPDDADLLFNIGICERDLHHPGKAALAFRRYTDRFPDRPDGWACLAECQWQLGAFDEGLALADRAIALDPALLAAWLVRANCQKSARQFDGALASYQMADRIQATAEAALHAGHILLETGRAAEAVERFTQGIRLDAGVARLHVLRGDAHQRLGDLPAAAADYGAALKLAPDDDAALKNATLCLLEVNQAAQALELCQEVLRARPDQLTARIGAEWVLSKMVPVWHVPMMNEHERNEFYHEGLRALVAPEKLVFEIGTGSGLLSMMAARLGAMQVVTCEAVELVAQTARRIVRHNGLDDRVTVLARPSDTVQIGPDLPRQADILVHEVFSSELLGEHVLPALEDAKARLLRPGAQILPSVASIMIALVGGDALGRNLRVDEAFGFDLSAFNAIYPKNRLLHRPDLTPQMMSNDVEAFRFDFVRDDTFPAEKKELEITATADGLCYGVIQWIRLELGADLRYDNHPAHERRVTGWQHMIFGFDEPVRVQPGSVLRVTAMHDRSRPWFQRAADAQAAGR